MGIIPTVIKKPEIQHANSANVQAGSEDNKILSSLNNKLEELKVQNQENAKFLRGVSRKIETGLEQIRELENDRSFEILDEEKDSCLADGIERIEKTVRELDNREVLEGIQRIAEELETLNQLNRPLQNFNPDTFLLEIDKMHKSFETNGDGELQQFERFHESVSGQLERVSESVSGQLERTNESVSTQFARLNENVSGQLERMSEGVSGQLERVSESVSGQLERTNENVSTQFARLNENVSGLNLEPVMSELKRLQNRVSEMNSDAVLLELDNLRKLIQEKDSEAAVRRIETTLSMLPNQDYTAQFTEINSMLQENAVQMQSIQDKIDRIATMPVMVKSVIQSENEKTLRHIDVRMEEIGQNQIKKIEGLKSIIGLNLWLSLLAVVLLIVSIIGFI